jgi:hypothetical protein
MVTLKKFFFLLSYGSMDYGPCVCLVKAYNGQVCQTCEKNRATAWSDYIMVKKVVDTLPMA